MGRPLPGYRVALLDPDGRPSDDGEIVVELDPPPVGLMAGYLDTPMPVVEAGGRRYYRTSDVASRDGDGYYWYVGRVDDVFKSSDYRISPFELESALIEHEAVAEAAVVPSPDALRLAVPKAFIVLEGGLPAGRGNGPLDLPLLSRTPRAVQARSTHRVLRAAEDHLGQDPPRAIARGGASRLAGEGANRVLGR